MRHCYILRVFTRGDDGGNHLGVIMDSTSLDGTSMQETAALLGFSETVFLDWPGGQAPSARIFTPTSELPFAGHPLVGAAWVLNAMGPGAGSIVCGVGEIGVSFDGASSWIDVPLQQPVVEADERAQRATRLGLPAPVSMAVVSMPLRYSVVELSSPDAVAAVVPDEQRLVVSEDGAMLLIWAWSGPDTVKARFFAPGHGILEDPATGSAAVALVATLVSRGRGAGDVTILQGDEVGHPSTIRASWTGGRVRIGGSVRRDEVRVLEI